MNPWVRIVYLVIVLAAVGSVVFGGSLAWFLTDWLWFSELGYLQVFETMLVARVSLGGVTGLLTAAFLYANARWALRTEERRGPVRVVLPPEVARSGLGRLLTRMPLQRPALAVAVIFGIAGGLMAAGWWDEVVLGLEGSTFGHVDPILGYDAGFYVFLVPALTLFRGLAVGVVVLAGLITGAIYVMREAIRIEFAEVRPGQYLIRGVTIERGTRAHLALLVAALCALMAAGAILRRYDVMYDQLDRFAGPGYADIAATFPLLGFEAVAALLGGGLLSWSILTLRRLPGLGAVALILGSWGLTAFVPNLVWRLVVEPNELVAEAPYIANNIAGTRLAFDLDAVETRELSGDGSLTGADIQANQTTIRNVRLWDHEPLLVTFAEVQEIATYYEFESVDNDRYVVGNELRQTMLSPRELFTDSVPDQSWVNTTMTYTHGYGVALGPVNEVTPEGLPKLFVQDLPPRVTHPEDLAITRPEIYFGEAPDTAVFVKTDTPEFDYPVESERVFTEYAGEGGLPIGNLLMRTLVAIRLGSFQLLLADDIRPDSEVLLYRNVVKRVDRIAPFLTYDGDPYMVVDQGRLKWIIEGFTRSEHFPYAQGIRGIGNYIRNSVKVVVDAYDGTVVFYRMPGRDPILDAWARVFPELFRPLEEMPASLRAHLRYPQQLFQMQAHMLATYHMTEPQVFYSNEDAWEVPAVGGTRMQPYYTVMKLPGEEAEEFILMLPFNRLNKQNLAAWMVARSDGEQYGKLRVYGFPKDKLVYGPKQIVARFDQNDEIAEKISLWNQQGSQVERGTLLVIPVEESLIYVQPLYLRAETGSIPELKRVIVGYENQVAMAPTLEAALERIFGEDLFSTPAVVAQPAPEPVAVEQVSGAPTVAEPQPSAGTWQDAARRAEATWTEANAAAQRGDWTRYGQLLDQLGNELAELRKMSEGSR